MSYAYTVRCRFDDPQVAERWARWMEAEHFQDLLDAGALRAELVALQGEGTTLECRYLFADQAAFHRYQEQHGPRLRAEGLSRFPLELGLHYSRSEGPVRLSRTPAPGQV